MTGRATAPKHLWFIGIVALLWNAMGAFDYVMTETRNEAYMSSFDQAQLDYFYGLPVWFVALWAIAVWGGLLGSILLLLRKGLAVLVFAVSFVAMVISTIYSMGFSGGTQFMGPKEYAFSLAIFVVALGLWIYARAMRTRGVLA